MNGAAFGMGLTELGSAHEWSGVWNGPNFFRVLSEAKHSSLSRQTVAFYK